MTLTKLLSASLAFLIMSPLALAFGAEHSKVVVSQAKQADGSVSLTFKVVPNADVHITDEAPWSLSFEPTAEATFLKPDDAAKNKYNAASYRKEIPGFTMAIKPQAGKKSGEVTYQLKAFVCTLDKTRCFPEAHKGTVKWQG